MSDTIAPVAFTEADLIAVRVKLRGLKHRAPPLAKLVAIPHGDPPRYRLRAMPDLDFSQGSVSPIRHTIIYGGPTPFLLPLPQPGGPVKPLVELDSYYRQDCEHHLMRGQPARSMLEFWRDEILFVSWKWADDFRLSVAREAAVEAWRQRVQERLDARLLSADDAHARDAGPTGSDVDVRQPRLPEAPAAHPAPPPRPSRRVLNDDAALDKIEQLVAGGYSEPTAINEVVPTAQRIKTTTKDKSVYMRLKGGLEQRRRSRALASSSSSSDSTS
jgi:hypothetical protein